MTKPPHKEPTDYPKHSVWDPRPEDAADALAKAKVRLDAAKAALSAVRHKLWGAESYVIECQLEYDMLHDLVRKVKEDNRR